MIYVSWGALYEGITDRAYFDVLIPRLVEEIIRIDGVRHSVVAPGPAIELKRGTLDAIAEQICRDRIAFEIVFLHSDTGGRALEAKLGERAADACEKAKQLCDWPEERCIIIAPKHELEAWALADATAVCETLGYRGTPHSVGLPLTPAQAAGLGDPKKSLTDAMYQIRGRRRPAEPSDILPAIAGRQDMTLLRQLPHFQRFEVDVRRALRHLHCIA